VATAQRAGLHQRHVARQHQPAGRPRTFGHAGGNGKAHAPRGIRFVEHDHVAQRHLCARDRGQRVVRDHHHRQLAADGLAQGRTEHREVLEGLRQLVQRPAEAAATARCHHDDCGAKSHAS
jgi:hypothetical protein